MGLVRFHHKMIDGGDNKETSCYSSQVTPGDSMPKKSTAATDHFEKHSTFRRKRRTNFISTPAKTCQSKTPSPERSTKPSDDSTKVSHRHHSESESSETELPHSHNRQLAYRDSISTIGHGKGAETRLERLLQK